MISREEAKRQIENLISRCKEGINKQGLDFYNEQQTCDDWILPLFKVLGWSNENAYDEVTCQSKTGRKKIDYLIRFNSNPIFILEAKGLNQHIKDNEQFYKQTINYGDNKSVTWGILTNFREFVILNCEVERPHVSLSEVRYINILEDFSEEKFDLLWTFSKESFLNPVKLEELNAKFLTYKKKEKIGVRLLNDLKQWREDLINEIKKHPRLNQFSKEDTEIFEQEIQRFLDRLIFIRACEDRDYEDKNIKELIKNKRESYTFQQGYLLKEISKLFSKYRQKYNSDLFEFSLCDKFYIEDIFLVKILEGMHSHKGIPYDFSQIDSDILGSIYEDYLGFIIKIGKTEIKHEENHNKKKEAGIYYTPIYIVNYILQNTLNKFLKNKSEGEIKYIKILDPACGSGSFLIKAYDLLENYYKIKNNSLDLDYGQKCNILLNNLFGVDLDERACEVAKLNLMLKAVSKNQKLPELKNNIVNGNSLINDENFAGLKAFKWEGNFEEGSFDIVIGNPPYGAGLSKEEQIYLNKAYDIGSTDTAILFIKKSFDLLKENGRLGFIVPKALCFASNYKKIRDFIWDNLETIVDCGKVWKEVKLEQVIFILSKGKKLKQYNSYRLKNGKIEYIGKINKTDAEEFGFFLNGVSSEDVELAKKIKSKSIMLNDISTNQRGAMLQKFVSEKGKLEVIGGAQVQRFGVIGTKGKIDSANIDSDQAYVKNNSLLVQNIVAHIENPTDHIKIIACIPDKNYVILDTINQLVLDKDFSPQFIWCFLNSKLINWYAYRFIFGKAIRTMHFDNSITSRLPIPKISKNIQNVLIEYTKEISKINKELNNIAKNSDNWKILNKKIVDALSKIDYEIYKMYNLTAKEISIIEESLK